MINNRQWKRLSDRSYFPGMQLALLLKNETIIVAQYELILAGFVTRSSGAFIRVPTNLICGWDHVNEASDYLSYENSLSSGIIKIADGCLSIVQKTQEVSVIPFWQAMKKLLKDGEKIARKSDPDSWLKLIKCEYPWVGRNDPKTGKLIPISKIPADDLMADDRMVLPK